MALDQGGVALVIVLWMLALLTLIATSVAGTTRTASTVARNSVEAMQARRLAESGFNRALLALAEPEADMRWAADGSEHAWSTELGSVRISIRDEAAFVNLNRADPDLLDGLLTVMDVPAGRRQALVEAILDWRDPDSIRRPRGAEDGEYAAAGRAYGAKDGPFDDTAELQRVIGMSAELFDRIDPFVTVHGQHAGINRDAAPREVLLALPGSDRLGVDRILDRRRAARRGEEDLRRTAAMRPGIVRVTVNATLESGATRGLRAVVSMRANSAPGFTILSWEESR